MKTFDCPTCSEPIEYVEAYTGKRVLCPHCDKPLMMPGQVVVDDQNILAELKKLNAFQVIEIRDLSAIRLYTGLTCLIVTACAVITAVAALMAAA